jgi:NAD(P)-dependent dehydrogenase (short-subunit alcohol dehydrogenase family)
MAQSRQGRLFDEAVDPHLADKYIAVIGGTGGIGIELTKKLSALGARLLATGSTQSSTRVLEKSVHCQTVACDLTSPSDIERVLLCLTNDKHRLDGLVFSAGVFLGGPIESLSTENIRLLFEVNVIGQYSLIAKLLERDLVNDNASVVFISSVLSQKGAKHTAAYSASKGAVSALSRALAAELAPRRIRVNTVSPSFVKTEMVEHFLQDGRAREAIYAEHPLGRIGEPEEIADAIIFLLSPKSNWITGIDLQVDGGRSNVI